MPKEDEHARAIDDIRFLINKYGQSGVWLWDPYLTAKDIVDTLFHCQFPNVDLRALTAGEQVYQIARRSNNSDSQETDTKKKKFIKEQQVIFESFDSNFRSIKLEYRIRHGVDANNFHDRFLIFPRDKGRALAWSLGTSVNSLGFAHHILQQTDNPSLRSCRFSARDP